MPKLFFKCVSKKDPFSFTAGMGTDIMVSTPEGSGTQHFHFSLCRGAVLIQYGLRLRDYHGKTVQDVLIALTHAIARMMTAGFKPLLDFEEWARNEEEPGALGNAIHFRNGLEAHTGLDWILWVDC